MYVVQVHVFFYEDILDLKLIFVIHYDPRLRHVFDDALVHTQQNNDGQQNERDGLIENIKEIDIHDDVENGYVQAQEGNNMNGIENDDLNTSSNNIGGLQSNFNGDEDDVGQYMDD